MWPIFGLIVGGLVGNLFENGSPSWGQKLQPVGLPTLIGAGIGAIVVPAIEQPAGLRLAGTPPTSGSSLQPRQVLR